MREPNKRKTAWLVTEDPAVETAARKVAARMGDELRQAKTNVDAMCAVFDAWPGEAFIVVDLDGHSGRRCLLNTAVGRMPVIAICKKNKPWLASMLKHRRIGATLTKPVSPTALMEAFDSVRHFHEGYARLTYRTASDELAS
jgi:hypothetical protein